MSKHKLIDLQKIIGETIGSLKEEVVVGTNVKLNALYIDDRRDEIQFLQWITRIIQSILNRDIDERQKLGIIKKRLEMMDAIEFENSLQERVQELKLKLKDCNNPRESDILINEIDTLDNDFKQAIRLRKQIDKIQDLESEISTQIQFP